MLARCSAGLIPMMWIESERSPVTLCPGRASDPRDRMKMGLCPVSDGRLATWRGCASPRITAGAVAARVDERCACGLVASTAPATPATSTDTTARAARRSRPERERRLVGPRPGDGLLRERSPRAAVAAAFPRPGVEEPGRVHGIERVLDVERGGVRGLLHALLPAGGHHADRRDVEREP